MIIINTPWLTFKNTIETQEICSLVTSGAGRVYHRGSLSLSSCGSSKWAVTFVITLLYHHPFIWLDYPRQIVSFYCRYRDHMAKMISRYLSAGFDFEIDNQLSTSIIQKQLSDGVHTCKKRVMLRRRLFWPKKNLRKKCVNRDKSAYIVKIDKKWWKLTKNGATSI